MSQILVIDDEPSLREMLSIMLRKEGHEVTVAESRASAAVALARGPVDLVITDLRLPDGDGMEILRHLKAASPDTIVIVMTAFGSTQTAVAALKLGACDYLIKPFDLDELRIVVHNALEREQLQRENVRLRAELTARHGGLDRLVGVSKAMVAVADMVRSVAPTNSSIFITGESGTGKELVARAVHTLSPRREAAFVSINCGALPEALLESELFGHVKGAFTDAHQHKKGLFEVAHRGTLFLDEVGEMPAAMQVKLLRALQEKRIRRVGGTDEIEVDVRVIAATNRPIESLLSEGHMRQDLYYRLNVIHVGLPPLRERREDIPILAQHFTERFAREMGKGVQRLSPAALGMLERHAWPGNVRELENVIERAVALETTTSIEVERLPPDLGGVGPSSEGARLGNGFSLDAHVSAVEASLVRRALETSGGVRNVAAALLGITPRSLRYLVRKHALGRADDSH